MYQQDNYIKSGIWSNVILLVGITLFCNQVRKSESRRKKQYNVIVKNCAFFRFGVSWFFSLAWYIYIYIYIYINICIYIIYIYEYNIYIYIYIYILNVLCGQY